MKFTDLTEKQINKARKIYLDKDQEWDKRMTKLVKLFGVSERTARKWCSEKLGFKEKADIEPEQYTQAKKRQIDKTKKRFIVTWAQNNTPVHINFLKNIEAYSKEINADIHIILGRYKNPTSVFDDKDKEYWSKEIDNYKDANRHDIHEFLSILSDVKIQPTATNPMTSMQGMSGVNSCIFGHPKVQLEMIPVLEGCMPKMMQTTGAVTLKNYTDSKSGKQGEFHHTFGFIIVEIKDDSTFFTRQVTADDISGNFNDLYFNVSNGNVTKINKIAALVLGDLHIGHHDPAIIEATLKLTDKLTPEHVILHDVFDGDSISHHQMKDAFVQFGKEVNGTNSLKREVDNMLTELKPFERFNNVVIVRSNHDDFLDRWLKNEDWKRQPTMKNAPEYMRYSSMLLQQYADNSEGIKGVIPAIINERYPKFITLGRSSSYKVKGWELGQHGDLAANGSRGSLLNFRKLNTKVIVAHYHSSGRKDGALSVGTSTKLRVGYNIGASSWNQSHVLIHLDGRSQHIHFTDGEFTTFKY